MDQISQHINSTNNKINYNDKMRKMIVHLDSKKYGINDDSYPKLTNLDNYLLIIIVETPENNVFHSEVKSLTRKAL